MWLYWVAVFLIVQQGWCLRDGAPDEACDSMNPGNRPGPEGTEGHYSWAQNLKPTPPYTRHPPFRILVSQTTYRPMERIQVHLVAVQEGIHNFYKGVLLQARRARCQSNSTIDTEGTAVGTFSLQEPSSLMLQTMNCWYGQSSITHKVPGWKVNETVTWTAPRETVGNIVFKATFLKEQQVFWTNVNSTVVRDLSVGAPPPCKAPHCNAPSVFIVLSFTVIVYLLHL